MKHTHGGDVYRYNGCIDFSANCNPLGTPAGVIEAIKKSAESVCHYPQVGSGRLREAIGKYEQVSPGQIFCGNGAAEVVFALCQALRPKEALLQAPTFAEYEQALNSVQCKISHYDTKEENRFDIMPEYLDYVSDKLDILFLCNPNNPTGMTIDRAFLSEVLCRCIKNNVLMVVDECFVDFLEDPESWSMKDELFHTGKLFILKAFTKRYGMAGVRLGYGLSSDEALLERMAQVTQPWNVSGIAQEAGLAALKEEEFVREGRRIVFEERGYLMDGLEKLGFHVFPSKANYIFFKGPEDLFEKCLSKGFLIRDCRNYRGLCPGYFRIAVKLHEENKKLLSALEEVLA